MISLAFIGLTSILLQQIGIPTLRLRSQIAPVEVKVQGGCSDISDSEWSNYDCNPRYSATNRAGNRIIRDANNVTCPE